MHKDVLLTPIEFQRQRAPQTIKISQRWLNTWVRGLCGDQSHVTALDDAAGSAGKMLKKKKRKESSDYCILWDLPDLGAIPSLGAHMAWVPLLNQGRVYTAVPFINTFLSFTVCYVWRAQESHTASKPRVISRQNSAGLNFCWCWGFQLKPPPPWGMLATP